MIFFSSVHRLLLIISTMSSFLHTMSFNNNKHSIVDTLPYATSASYCDFQRFSTKRPGYLADGTKKLLRQLLRHADNDNDDKKYRRVFPITATSNPSLTINTASSLPDSFRNTGIAPENPEWMPDETTLLDPTLKRKQKGILHHNLSFFQQDTHRLDTAFQQRKRKINHPTITLDLLLVAIDKKASENPKVHRSHLLATDTEQKLRFLENIKKPRFSKILESTEESQKKDKTILHTNTDLFTTLMKIFLLNLPKWLLKKKVRQLQREIDPLYKKISRVVQQQLLENLTNTESCLELLQTGVSPDFTAWATFIEDYLFLEQKNTQQYNGVNIKHVANKKNASSRPCEGSNLPFVLLAGIHNPALLPVVIEQARKDIKPNSRPCMTLDTPCYNTLYVKKLTTLFQKNRELIKLFFYQKDSLPKSYTTILSEDPDTLIYMLTEMELGENAGKELLGAIFSRLHSDPSAENLQTLTPHLQHLIAAQLLTPMNIDEILHGFDKRIDNDKARSITVPDQDHLHKWGLTEHTIDFQISKQEKLVSTLKEQAEGTDETSFKAAKELLEITLKDINKESELLATLEQIQKTKSFGPHKLLNRKIKIFKAIHEQLLMKRVLSKMKTHWINVIKNSNRGRCEEAESNLETVGKLKTVLTNKEGIHAQLWEKQKEAIKALVNKLSVETKIFVAK